MIGVLIIIIVVLIALLLIVLNQYNILWDSIKMLAEEIEGLRKELQYERYIDSVLIQLVGIVLNSNAYEDDRSNAMKYDDDSLLIWLLVGIILALLFVQK